MNSPMRLLRAIAATLAILAVALLTYCAAYMALPVEIFRLLGRPGPVNFGAAMAASVILMALTGLAVLGIERLRVGSVGGF